MRPSSHVATLAGIFCGTLVCSLVLSGKIVGIAGMTFPASIVLFPATFLISDILTEVYGYAVTRRVVWAGLATEIIWIASYWTAAALPPAAFWPGQDAFVATLGATPRIAVAGMLAYAVGEFLSAYVLARLKVATDGRALSLRLIGSTFVGAGADTLVVIAIAFGGTYPIAALLVMAATVWALKVAWEIMALPVSLPFIAWLKRHDGADHFDRDTDFSPFRLGWRPKSDPSEAT